MHDFVIIGHGIAGAVLAETLESKGASVAVFDFFNPNSSSRVAAGLCNPITGRKFSLTWKANEIFPKLDSFYSTLQKDAKVEFYVPMDIFRVCASMQELNDWSGKASLEQYRTFTSTSMEPDQDIIEAPYGTIGTSGGGFVRIPEVLEHLADRRQNFYTATRPLKEEEIEVLDEKVVVKGIEGKHLIFCDGFHANWSRFFGFLPFTPMKGEILELNIPDFYSDRVFIRGGFLIPFKDDIFLAGATYDWKNINFERTTEARDNILSRIQTYVKPDIKVVGHRAGVRPAVKDRKPLIGTHPKNSNVHLFNGLGSKGTSLAPYLADIFSEYLMSGDQIPEEVNLNRFS